MTDPTSYTFKDVYMFSDEEGGAPFLFEGDPDGKVAGGNDEGIPSELQREFTITKPTNVNGGLITDINNTTTGLVFLGDLLDNEDCSIRALESMCSLKDKKPTQVLLIGGNRDFNKIRLGFELYITCKGKLPWTDAADFKGMVDTLANETNICEFREKGVPSYITEAKLKPWNNAMAGIQKNFTSQDIKDRVTKIYTGTLGAGQGVALFKKELNDMYPGANILTLNDTAFAKVMCAVQMLMTFKWDGLSSDFERLNGLYLKYLERCHVLALFEIGGKYGVVSHGGFPTSYKNKDNIVIKKTLTSPFGYIPEESGFTTPSSLKQLLLDIEEEKKNLVRSVQELRETGFSIGDEKQKAYNAISKFVHLTALTKLPKGANSGSSPIVGFQPIEVNARTGNIKVKLEGGSLNWINANLAKPNTNKKVLNTGDTTIYYDIYGHYPQGFVPTAYREAGTDILHVNLDVSKIEGATNKYSFAMLHLKQDNEKVIAEFIGRFKMPSEASFNANTKKHAGMIVYYRVNIPDGEVKLLKNVTNASRFTDKLPVKVTVQGYARSYSSRPQGGARKGKKSRKIVRKGRKGSKTRKH